MSDGIVTREEILAIWGMRGESLVYEGCQGLVEDGRVCALGITVRRARQLGVYREGTNSRNRSGHTCEEIGEGSHMFCSLVRTSVGRCQMWEEAGMQLFGMSGD